MQLRVLRGTKITGMENSVVAGGFLELKSTHLEVVKVEKRCSRLSGTAAVRIPSQHELLIENSGDCNLNVGESSPQQAGEGGDGRSRMIYQGHPSIPIAPLQNFEIYGLAQ